MQELVSVIIPVYKVEKYLRKCVDSVLSQTYKNLEIFLVDDGSPDNCGKICDEYAKKEARIKVIHKQNGGLSSARNAALDVCTGEYITFIDSDDCVEPTYVEKLYDAIKKYDCDISVCGDNFVDESGRVLKQTNFKEDFYKKDQSFEFFYGTINRHFAWGKLYEKHIFEELRYPNGLNYEDTYVVPEICKLIEKGICIISDRLYNYLHMRDGAITNDVSAKIFDWVVAKKHALEIIPSDSKAYESCCWSLFFSYTIMYKRVKNNKDLSDKMEKMFLEDYKAYKKYLSFNHKIKFFIFKNFRKIYYKLWK